MKKKMLFLLVLSLCLSGLLVAADVENPDKPLKGDWDLKAKKLWEVSNYGKKVMAMPAIGAVLDDETLCVYDFRSKENYLFDSNGKFVASFGKKGKKSMGSGDLFAICRLPLLFPWLSYLPIFMASQLPCH